MSAAPTGDRERKRMSGEIVLVNMLNTGGNKIQNVRRARNWRIVGILGAIHRTV